MADRQQPDNTGDQPDRAISGSEGRDTIPDEPSASRSPAPLPSIRGYRLQKELNRGGQSVVFLAVQESTGQRVAIKVMLEGVLAGSQEQARFEREARVLVDLRHPNIVSIIDRGMTEHDEFYLVMEHIDGHPLDQYLRNYRKTKPLPPDREDIEFLLGKMIEICDAVEAAHRMGIVHRDLKPSNIRIDANGQPHVLDFGLARTGTTEDVTQASATLTVTGQFVGSMPWASPEQADHNVGRISPRTDVYALGVVFYQMLTGQFPYEITGAMRDVLDHILTSDPTPPSQILDPDSAGDSTVVSRTGRSSAIGALLEAIVLKALSKRPGDRYESAGALAADLRNYLAGAPTVAQVQRPPSQGSKPAKIAAAVAVCAVVLVSATAAFWPGAGPSPPPQPVAPDPSPDPPVVVPASYEAFSTASHTPITPADGWVDLIDRIEPRRDTVAGLWRHDGETLTMAPSRVSRLALPLSVEGSYELEIEFTRTSGDAAIYHFLPIGDRQVNFELSASRGEYAGFFHVDGKPWRDRADELLSPAALENGRKHKLLVQVQRDGEDLIVATELNGVPYYQWQGAASRLSSPESQSLPHLGTLGIGGNHVGVRYHAIRLRMFDGEATPIPLSGPTLPLQPPNLTPGEWVNVLSQVDPRHDSLAGRWIADYGGVFKVGDPSRAGLRVPVSIVGSYRLRGRFVSTLGGRGIGVVLPVGQTSALLSFGHETDGTSSSGLALVDGHAIDTPENPTRVLDHSIDRGREYEIEASVRVSGDTANIEVKLDGEEFLQWHGDPGQLSLPQDWNVGNHHVGLVTDHASVKFRSLDVQIVDGIGRLDRPRRTPLPTPEPIGPGPWIDLLARTDATRDAIDGKWDSNDTTLRITDHAEFGRLSIPVTTTGSYRVRGRFVRTSGELGIGFHLPVGDRTILLVFDHHTTSGSGLDMIDRKGAWDANNPTSVQPHELENGREYAFEAEVRVEGESVTINILVDDEEFLQWSGERERLQMAARWIVSPSETFGLMAESSQVEFRQLELQMIEGEAQPLYEPTTAVARDPDDSVDFVSLIDTNRDAVRGSWKLENGAIVVSQGDKAAALRVPYKLPEDYRIECELTRTSGDDSFAFVLPIGPTQCRVAFDGYRRHISGLQVVDGLGAKENETRVDHRRFVNGRTSRLAVEVRNERITADWDGERVIDWSGEVERLSIGRAFVYPMLSGRQPYIDAYASSYRISKFKVVPLSEGGRSIPPSHRIAGNAWIDLLKLPAVDAPSWKRQDNELASGAGQHEAHVLPVRPLGYYRARIEFTVDKTGDDAAALAWVFPAGQGEAVLLLDGNHSGLVGFRPTRENETHLSSPAIARGVMPLTDGKRHALDVQVIPHGDNVNITVDLDGEPYVRWMGPQAVLVGAEPWRLEGHQSMGLIARRAAVRVHAASAGLGNAGARSMQPFDPELVATEPPSLDNSIDLLPMVNPRRDALVGQWERTSSMLQIPQFGNRNCNLQIPYRFPKEYRLEIAATRTRGTQTFKLNLPVGGQHVTLLFDGKIDDRSVGGLSDIAGSGIEDNATAFEDLDWPIGEARYVVCTVRDGHITVDRNGVRVIDWRGSFDDLSLRRDFLAPEPGCLYLGSFGSAFTVSHLQLTPLRGEGAPVHPRYIETDQWINALKLVDPQRDAGSDQWTRDEDTLVSRNDSFTHLSIPIAPTGGYRIRTVISRTAIHDESSALAVVMPAGDSRAAYIPDFGAEGLSGIAQFKKQGVKEDNPLTRQLDPMANNRPYRIEIEVVPTGKDVAVKIWRDGELIHQFDTPQADLNMWESWMLPDDRGLGVALRDCDIVIHEYQVKLLNGHARLLRPVDAALLPDGARVTHDANLLKLIDVQRHRVEGDWRFEGDVLVSPDSTLRNFPRLRIPYEPSGQYDIELELERRGGNGMVAGLVYRGQSTLLVVDGWDEGLTGLAGLDDSDSSPDDEVVRNAGVLKDDARVRVVCQVRDTGFKVTADGQTIIDWKGDMKRLRRPGAWPMPNPREMMIGSECSLRVHRMVVKPLLEPSR